ncbi:hypothetical protein R1sor_019187 [Riccia sorocarpa]|uniref:Uncharacterized protein n=1 Tax=Riccia sorocarpa TaxID=122646 RepID=A0ABD3IFL3_9MARC
MLRTRYINGTQFRLPSEGVSNMSLVRICVVTMTVLRLFLCMCWCARLKERQKKQEATIQEGTDEEQACGSLITSQSRECSSPHLKHEFVPGLIIGIKKQIPLVSAFPRVIFVRKLRPNLTPQQVLVDPESRQVWQDERFLPLLQRWLGRTHRKKKFHQHQEGDFNGLHTLACLQVVENQTGSKAVSKSEIEEEQKLFPTIAWVEPLESYDPETPCCSYKHDNDEEEEERMSNTQEFPELEQTVKTLLHDFLTRDDSPTVSHKECSPYLDDACSSRYLLPNQIVGLDHPYRATSPQSLPRHAAIPICVNTNLSLSSE